MTVNYRKIIINVGLCLWKWAQYNCKSIFEPPINHLRHPLEILKSIHTHMYNATQANKYTCKQVDGDERQHSPALTISVTRCWNKKVAQIFQKLAQKKPMHFYNLKK